MRIAVRIQRDIATLLAALTLLNVVALAQRADVRISNNDRGHRMLASARVQRASWNGECFAVVHFPESRSR